MAAASSAAGSAVGQYLEMLISSMPVSDPTSECGDALPGPAADGGAGRLSGPETWKAGPFKKMSPWRGTIENRPLIIDAWSARAWLLAVWVRPRDMYPV